MEQLGTRLNICFAYHKQMDGNAEYNNQSLEDLLRATISTLHQDWEEHLQLVKFAFNNPICIATGYSPFFLELWLTSYNFDTCSFRGGEYSRPGSGGLFTLADQREAWGGVFLVIAPIDPPNPSSIPQ
eukprot:TRINITY_DN26637_c0_g1_i1.p1 TRINITY_DN26637_c0_g1~~TRINITY_DN26637_c0_g1_i1.p1  ORF type:complete len:128 (+),score=5.64 TRINITY_DN26637_c0_g1_i1:303-686(+)